MGDEKQMTAIRNFCAKPYSQHGQKRISGKGRQDHDWSDLVDQISYFDLGHVQKDEAAVQAMGRLVRKEFPNGSDWNVIVNAPGAHDRILAIIRGALAAQTGAKPEEATAKPAEA